jgi:pSer/pThr/pTyr-binding forkhead associated (FHA) protein
MALTIVVRSGDSASPPAISFDSPKLVIGRGDGCEVRLPDSSVSHRHASIQQRGGDYIVVDEGSTNGTCVGPVRLSPHAPRVLRSNDVIRVGRVELEVRIESVPQTKDVKLRTKEIALKLVAETLEAQGEPAAATVKVVEGPDAGRELAVATFERAHVVGRSPKADLSVSDPDASRRHVEISRRGSELWVADLGSKNGSELDGKPLAQSKPRAWREGARLKVGQNVLVFDDPVSEALRELEQSADERLRDSDSVAAPEEEPDSTPDDDSSEHRGEPPQPEEQGALAGRAGAPIARAPRRRSQPNIVRRIGGWRAADLLVAVLALVVLGLSVLGLLWLFELE